MRQIMKRAWEIAREGQAKFGGKVSEYISEALKIAWSEYKTKKVVLEMDFDNKIMNFYAIRSGKVFFKRENVEEDGTIEVMGHLKFGLKISNWDVYEIKNGRKTFRETKIMKTEKNVA